MPLAAALKVNGVVEHTTRMPLLHGNPALNEMLKLENSGTTAMDTGGPTGG